MGIFEQLNLQPEVLHIIWNSRPTVTYSLPDELVTTKEINNSRVLSKPTSLYEEQINKLIH